MESILLISFISLLFTMKIKNNNTNIYKTYKGKTYKIRDDKNFENTCILLYNIENKLNELINIILNDINEKHQMYNYIFNIYNKLKTVKIEETPINSKDTSYSINKGDFLVFCLKCKKTNKYIDINEILYVAIHEIAHIGCPEIGHTKLFLQINKFLLQYAINHKIYTYIDYNKHNANYCGITLTSNIL